MDAYEIFRYLICPVFGPVMFALLDILSIFDEGIADRIFEGPLGELLVSCYL